MHGIELTEEDMILLVYREIWLQEKVLGNDWYTQQYIHDYFGGYNEFYQINLWEYLFPEKFGIVVEKGPDETLVQKSLPRSWDQYV